MSVVMQRKDISDMSSAMSTRASFSSSDVDENALDEAEAGSSGCVDGWTSPYPAAQGSPSPPVQWARRRYAPTLESLHDEVVDLYNWLKPTGLDVTLRHQTIGRVCNALAAEYPQAQFFLFGSVAMGLFLPTSDIDITMHFDGSTVKDLHKTAALLRQSKLFQNIQVVDKTSVPVVKFRDAQTLFNIDMSINTLRSQRVVDWVECAKQELSSLEPLVLVLKQLLTEHSLNEPFNGGLSSYALILMVVHFLKAQPFGLNPFPDQPLGWELLRFLQFYGVAFDYANYGLRFGDRAEYVKKDDLAKEMGEEKATSFLFIKDPLQDENNVGKGAHSMFNVKNVFHQAANVLQSVFFQCNMNTDRQLIFEQYCGPMLSLVVKALQIGEQRLWLQSVAAANGLLEVQVDPRTWAAAASSSVACSSLSNPANNSFVPVPPVCSQIMVPLSVFPASLPPPQPLPSYAVVASRDYVPANRQASPRETVVLQSAPSTSSLGKDHEAVVTAGASPAPMPAFGVPSNGMTHAASATPLFEQATRISTTSVPVTFRPLPPQPVSFPTSTTFPPLPASSPPVACGSAKPPIQTSANCFVQMSVNTECTNVSSGMPSLMQTATTSPLTQTTKTDTEQERRRSSGPAVQFASAR